MKVTEFRELQPEKADTVFFLKTPKAFEEKKKERETTASQHKERMGRYCWPQMTFSYFLV